MKNNNSFDRDYIGFATLPEQVHRKSVKRGFDFTLMVVGESGLGKSTLVNSLFLGDLYKGRVLPNAAERLERTTRIEKKAMEIEEKGVRLRLTIVDTPGFGDGTNCEESWRSCISYVEEQVSEARLFCVFFVTFAIVWRRKKCLTSIVYLFYSPVSTIFHRREWLESP